MSVAAARAPWMPVRPRWGSAGVVLVSIVAVAGFVAMRASVELPYPTFHGACERLRASGLPLTPRDWFCQEPSSSIRSVFTAASVLMAAGFVIPCMILAATGRRITALLPLLLVPLTQFQTVLVSDRWWATSWRGGTLEARLLTALLLAAPAAAMMLARRDRRRRPPVVSLVACAAAWTVVGTAGAAVVWISKGMFVRHFEVLGGTFTPGQLVPGAIAMALFGALLGPDRRWWPWALVPVAFLLSAGPSGAIIVGPEGLQDWSGFGAVVPLFAVGLIATAWRPIAERTTRLLRRRAGADVSVSTFSSAPVADAGRVRPTTVLNALGAGSLLVSLVIFRADPLPAQIGVALPTYLGARTTVADLRTRALLWQALGDMDGYRAKHGSYEGFDARTAAEVDPDLVWQRGLPHGPDGTRAPELTMGIVTASDTTARLVAISPTGAAVCIQRDAAGITYGTADRRSFGTAAPNAARRAVLACGETPWSPAALRPFPVTSMCDGLGREDGYLICRMVQVVLVDTLERTGPI